MRNRSLIPVVLLLGVLTLSKVVYGCWAAVPLEEVVKRNPLIVIGKIESVKQARPRGNERAYDTAFIKVRKVLKNGFKGYGLKAGMVIRLEMPSVNNKARISTDLLFKNNTDGIWLLSYNEKRKTFGIGRPDELQPLSKEQKINNVIKSKPVY